MFITLPLEYRHEVQTAIIIVTIDLTNSLALIKDLRNLNLKIRNQISQIFRFLAISCNFYVFGHFLQFSSIKQVEN